MKCGTSWISRKGEIFEKGGGVHLEKGKYESPYQLWKFFSAVVTKNYRNQRPSPGNFKKDIGSQHCGEIILNRMTLQYSYSEKYNKE